LGPVIFTHRPQLGDTVPVLPYCVALSAATLWPA
jgi:hypothetical protein